MGIMDFYTIVCPLYAVIFGITFMALFAISHYQEELKLWELKFKILSDKIKELK